MYFASMNNVMFKIICGAFCVRLCTTDLDQGNCILYLTRVLEKMSDSETGKILQWT